MHALLLLWKLPVLTVCSEALRTLHMPAAPPGAVVVTLFWHSQSFRHLPAEGAAGCLECACLGSVRCLLCSLVSRLGLGALTKGLWAAGWCCLVCFLC